MDKHGGKVTVIGAGSIGSITAYTLMMRQSASEIVLVNRNSRKAEIKAFDMSHCTPLLGKPMVTGGEISQSAGSDVIIMTIGTLPEIDGNRLDVLEANLRIYEDWIPKLVRLSPDAVILVVTNPVDLMALGAVKFSGFPSSRILGTGTLIDTLRFRHFIAEAASVAPDDVEALIIGEHGEAMLPVWSQVKIKGLALDKYVDENQMPWNQLVMDKLLIKTKRAGWRIREGNEHSSYAIAFSAALMTEAVLRDLPDFLPVSFNLKGRLDDGDLFMSLPARLGRAGVVEMKDLALSREEQSMLQHSAKILKRQVETIGLFR